MDSSPTSSSSGRSPQVSSDMIAQQPQPQPQPQPHNDVTIQVGSWPHELVAALAAACCSALRLSLSTGTSCCLLAAVLLAMLSPSQGYQHQSPG
jgi:hypothetical protein